MDDQASGIDQSSDTPLFEEPDRACSRCRTTKPPTAFHRTGNRRRRMCAQCRSETRPPKFPLETPEKKRRGKLRRAYGISLEQYHSMLAAQGGMCAICGIPPAGRQGLHVDHCHQSGRVRALLCGSCNRQLGTYEKLRQKAVTYLAEYGEGNPLLEYGTSSPMQSSTAA